MAKVISPTGEILDDEGNEIFKELSSLVAYCDVILDLSEVTFVASKPFGQFVALNRMARESGTEFRIQGVRPGVKHAMEFLHLSELIHID